MDGKMGFAVYHLEKAKSNNSFCKFCRKKIEKGELRGDLDYRGFLCWKCLSKKLREQKDDTSIMMRKFNRWFKRNQGRLVAEEL